MNKTILRAALLGICLCMSLGTTAFADYYEWDNVLTTYDENREWVQYSLDEDLSGPGWEWDSRKAVLTLNNCDNDYMCFDNAPEGTVVHVAEGSENRVGSLQFYVTGGPSIHVYLRGSGSLTISGQITVGLLEIDGPTLTTAGGISSGLIMRSGTLISNDRIQPHDSRENGYYGGTVSADCERGAFVMYNYSDGSVSSGFEHVKAFDAQGNPLIYGEYVESEWLKGYAFLNADGTIATSLRIEGEVADQEPEEPAAPEADGYDVTLTARSGTLWAEVIAPESADQNTNYSIEFYSSESGKVFGNGGFPAGVTAVVVPEAAKETYDRVRLINWDTQDVLMDVEMEKPVYTDVLKTPVGVTVSRVEENEKKDRYTVTGIDLTKYSYELSDSGYGGKVENKETFTVSKNYYGDVETFYVRIFEARESDSVFEEPGFYFNVSPYAKVFLGGEAPADPPADEDMAVSNFRLTVEDGVLLLRWDEPAGADENTMYDVFMKSADGEAVHFQTGVPRVTFSTFAGGTYSAVKIGTVQDGEIVAEAEDHEILVVLREEHTEPLSVEKVKQTAKGDFDFYFSGARSGASVMLVLDYVDQQDRYNSKVYSYQADADGKFVYTEIPYDLELFLGFDAKCTVIEYFDAFVDGKTGGLSLGYHGEPLRVRDMFSVGPGEPEKPEAPIVSGTVSGVGSDSGAMVSIVVDGTVLEAPVNEDGSFALGAVKVPFDLVVKTPGALSYTVKNIVVDGGDITLPDIEPVRGDTNGDDMINIMDMGAFRQNFGKAGAAVQNAFADTNGDGVVNIMDMGTFRKNFGKTAAKDCTVEYSA